MEDNAFVYRSMYHEHLQHWLKFFPPSQLLVLPSEALFEQQSIGAAFLAWNWAPPVADVFFFLAIKTNK